jgi:hypothetical protein
VLNGVSIHTLLLREHNRLCDIVLSQHPDWDDERVYQTMKLVMSSKIALIGACQFFIISITAKSVLRELLSDGVLEQEHAMAAR